MSTLAAPSVFEDQPTYRLLDADLLGERPSLTFGHGTYFQAIDTGEAAAHEYALDTPIPDGLRAAVGTPWNMRRRATHIGISTLTVRLEPHGRGEATYFLHWRNPAKVGHAGGLYQVCPVGVFQPSAPGEHNEHADFSLWHNMIREFAEELRGEPEHHGGASAPIDYLSWPFAEHLDTARANGQVRPYCLGLGVDPLTYAVDLLTMVIIDAPVFDELFDDPASHNAEGIVLSAQPFTPASIQQSLADNPFQPAAAALLELASRMKHC